MFLFKKIISPAFLFIAFNCLTNGNGYAQNKTASINSLQSLQQNLQSPSQHYGSAPLWVWNTNVDTASIKDMLHQFKQNAFGGVFIHPRAGLITPYLSKQWLDMYKYSVDEAKKMGLDLWIYDENSYPSGFAGGHVPAEMPESYNEGEMLELKKATNLPSDAKSFFICLKKENGKFIDITNKLDEEKDKTGDYYLFKKTLYYQSPWYGGYSYVDLMKKGVTEKFIDVTMKPYEKTIGNEFGKTVRGIFSDEPNIEVQYPNSIRWTHDLFDSFYKKWDYHLEDNLPSLFEEIGEWKKVRHNYYQVLLQLFIDRWSKPFSEYARQKNLEWTGHYWEHAWPSPNTGPDNMAMYAWPQRPGIDMLFNQFNEDDVNAQFGNIRSVKELTSVANQLNKKRVLSETYGGGGWELSFKDMKRLGDWEFSLGINTLNQHLSFMSIKGARKYDYPQSFSYHEPWWHYYKYLNEYFSRLTVALTSGGQFNDILIIEPTTTAWMYFTYDRPNEKFKETGEKFQRFITKLEKSEIEYDLGSENIIRDHGKIEQSNFIVGDRNYKTVVIPPGMENIDMSTFLLIKKYAENGGEIIQFNQLKFIDGSENKMLDDFYAQKYKSLISFDSLDNSIVQKNFINKDCLITKDESSPGDLYHYRRKLQDGELIFLSNSSMDQSAKGIIQVNGADILMMDLFSCQTYSYPHTQTQNSAYANFDIPPAGSLLFFSNNKKINGYKKFVAPDIHGKSIDAVTSIKRSTDNSLTIDFCDLQIGDTLLKEKHVYDAADTVFKHYGFNDGNPWNTSVQFKDNTIKRDTFSKGTGFTASYYFNIKEGVDFSTLKAVVEMQVHWKVFINDKEIMPVAGKWWIDKDFKIFDISKYVSAGKNKLSIIANPMSVYAEIEPVYILGNFGLSSADKGWDIVKPQPLQLGSWKNQGMAMYGQQVNYAKEININNATTHKYFVQLGEWEGTAATVTVNNKIADVVALPPYNMEISKYLKPGKNLVEVNVIGSLKNVFGPHHRKPAPGLVSPWHWRYVTNYSAGKDYDLYDYGLTEDFKIIEQ